jgi:hypothetical protein
MSRLKSESGSRQILKAEVERWQVSDESRRGNYDPFLLDYRNHQTLRGAKRAQSESRFVVIIQLFGVFFHTHNLKVTGSNPVPATKMVKTPAISIDCWGFLLVLA